MLSTSPSGYVTAFGEFGVPNPGLEGGVGCNPRVTFDGKVRNLDHVLKFDSPLPEDHRVNILLTANSPCHHCKLGGGSASISGISIYEGPSGVGGSSDGQDEQSLIVLPPEKGGYSRQP